MRIPRYSMPFCAAALSLVILFPRAIHAEQRASGQWGFGRNDPYGIIDAMAAGDVDKLQALGREGLPPPADDLAKAAYYRSIFRLDSSSEYARRCSSFAGDARKPRPPSADICSALLSGNAAMQGDMAAWASLLWDTADPGTPPPFDPGAYGNTPRSAISPAAAEHVVPNLWRDDPAPAAGQGNMRDVPLSARRPFAIGITLNGVRTIAILDTGTNLSVIRPEVAKSAKVRINPAAFGSISTSYDTKGDIDSPRIHLGTADSLDIADRNGAVAAAGRHIPAVVTGNVNLVGTQLLEALGAVLLEEDQLVIHPANVRCGQPLHIASRAAGEFLLALPLKINGKVRNAAFDTGNSEYLTGTGVASHGPDATAVRSYDYHTINGERHASYYVETVTLGDGKTRIPARIVPDDRAPYPYVAGLPFLRDHDVYIDFQKRLACVFTKHAR
ncbi:hypothetical protein [Rhodanobacter sp. DHB23]|uniref:hypothetical protein n=1 Tax=Rhodanobacter sp. DHB23 TaxID=2775923 RepID=UPI0017806DF9|nr:hypothetical protein [Rhodanobacter sp. DHB23]MBD8873215.1 hypothetical protein [Rhodanobacter sp. DHB23]